jgi:hypothetical protein
LEISAIVLVLKRKGLPGLQKIQENIYVSAVVRQMADVDGRGANLRSVVPKNVSVSGITRGYTDVSAVQEIAG